MSRIKAFIKDFFITLGTILLAAIVVACVIAVAVYAASFKEIKK